MIVRVFEGNQEVEGEPNEIVEYFISLEREHDRYEIEQKLYLIEAFRQSFEKEKKEWKKKKK